jgi:hypothetical protein
LKFGATHPSKLKQIVKEKEQTVKSLQQNLPDLVSQLTSLLPDSQQQGKVLYYEGKEGLEQVSYNITRAQGELRVFEMEHLDDFLDYEFSEQIRRELVDKQIITRDLTNKESFSGFTDVNELIKKYSQYRYISPDKLKIQFETLIYNDVYATYNYRDGNIFCVEIYNAQLAQMQKQLFDFIWQQAAPMQFTNDRGAAEVNG